MTNDFELEMRGPGPHHGQPVLMAGASLAGARAAFILLHGRGAAAAEILQLADVLAIESVAFIAPQASNFTWYPHRFLAPLESNEPWLGSALENVEGLVQQLEGRGIGPDRIVIGGFSQGACLALEAAARSPRRYGGIVGWSGGLIGPPGTQWAIDRALAGTPLFLGCSDNDPHIPAARVMESSEAFTRAGAEVTTVLYPGMGHTINAGEIDHVRRMLAELPVHGL